MLILGMSLPIAYGMGIAISAGAAYIYRSWKGKDTRRRSLSFNSKVMLTGAFPDDAAVAAPIINILMFFEVLPTIEELEKSITDNLVFYDRFRCTVRKASDGGMYAF